MRIRLTEARLNRVIKESVRKILRKESLRPNSRYKYLCIGKIFNDADDTEIFAMVNSLKSAQKVCEEYDEFYVDTKIEKNPNYIG
jgi:hypothetical protein